MQQPTGMYAGGRVTKMAGGSNGAIDRNSYTLPQIIGGGLSDLSDWWNSGPTYAPRLNPRDPLVEIDPETGEPIQKQSPVDPREANAITAPVAPVTAPAADPFAAPQTTTTSSSGSGGSGASSGKMLVRLVRSELRLFSLPVTLVPQLSFSWLKSSLALIRIVKPAPVLLHLPEGQSHALHLGYCLRSPASTRSYPT